MRHIESYSHQNRIGVLVELEIGGGSTIAMPEVKELALGLAMQIAASNPIGIDGDEILNVLSVRYRPSEAPSGEMALLQQRYIKDDSKSVGELIESVSAKLKASIRVCRFARFSIDDV